MKPRPIKRVLEWLFSTIFIILVALSVFIIIPAVLKSASTSQSQAGLSLATGTTGPVQTAYPAASRPWRNPSPTYPLDYPPDKQTLEVARELTYVARILTSPPNNTVTPGPSVTVPPTETRPPLVPGIYNYQAAPVSTMDYAMSNWWINIVNGEETTVFVGARRDNPGVTQDASQGVVLVRVYSRDGKNYSLKFYNAPLENTGLLTITAEAGYRLTIQTESGVVLYFDVPTRQFVDSLAAAVTVTTVTPLPTVLPTLLTRAPFPVQPATPASTSYP